MFFKKIRKSKKGMLDFEETFLDNRVKKMGGLVTDRKMEEPLGKKPFFAFLFLGVLSFLLVLGLAFNFQILRGKYYVERAEENKFINLFLNSERGIIYDRNSIPLVSNEFSYSLRINPSVVSKILFDRTMSAIGERGDYEKLSADSKVVSELSREQIVILKTKFAHFPGIKVEKSVKRNYLEGAALSHILGFTGKISQEEFSEKSNEYEINDIVGREGVEKSYENYLKEKKGLLKIERDAKGEVISQEIFSQPSSGDNLVLSLDLNLQKKAKEVIEKTLKKSGEAAAFVILNSKNGEVLSSVSLPSFSSNDFAGGISEERLKELNASKEYSQMNRVLGGVYPSGSVIKPFLALAGLEEGIIGESQKLYCPEKLCVEVKYSNELDCFPDWSFHGWTDVKRAIAESVNPFFYMLGGGYKKPENKKVDERLPNNFTGLGAEKIYEWLKKFNWGERTNIDLPGEVYGRVSSPDWKENYFKDYSRADKLWYLADTYNLSIGQGYLLVTPLQVATSLQAIANGAGVIYKPRLGKKILGENEEMEIKSEILRTIRAEGKNIAVVREGMRQAVSSPNGSAHSLSNLPVSVAAKTGTAQTSKEEVYHNWIAVFAPYENPEIIAVLVVENVEGVQATAQRTIYEILNWYFSQNKQNLQ